MRIAIFHNLSSSGGAKRALVEMARQLRDRGHVLHAYLPATAEERFLPLADVVDRVERFEVIPWALPAGTSLAGAVTRIPRFVRTIRAAESVEEQIAARIDADDHDVAFVHHGRYTQAPWILRHLETPAAYYCQEPPRDAYEREHAPGMRGWARLWLPGVGWARVDRANAMAADHILANSFYSRESILRAYGLDSAVVYLGVDVTAFAPGARARQPVVLSVGALHPRKGHALVLDAVSRIPARRRPRVRIIGDRGAADYTARLRELAQKLNVELTLNASLVDRELIRAYQESAVVVCAAQLEPFGLVAIEAAACATPVVAIREGGLRESVVHDSTGILVDRRDAAAIADATDTLLREPQLWARLSANSASWAREHWTWDRTGDRLETELRSVKARAGDG